MIRTISVLILTCALCTAAYSQSSGPGPDPATGDTQKQYDVVLYQRTTTQKGSMIFFAAADTSSAHTTGDFESNIDDQQLTGTWSAYDFGLFAFWYAHASADTNKLTAIGWATPDFIVGRVTMNANRGFLSFLNLFSRNTYLLHGTASASPAANAK
jgi:hypothetical protein